MHIFWALVTAGACAAAGFWFLFTIFENSAAGVLGALGGLLFTGLLDLTVRRMRLFPTRMLLGGLIGLFSGLAILVITRAALPDGIRDLPSLLTAQLFAGIALVYFGLVLGGKKGEEFSLEEIARTLRKSPSDEGNFKILDTSVIIDGRIADICDTGFMEGTLIVPQFILRELQHIADSPDSLKRNRGRRGLDILQRMQKKPELNVKLTDKDFPKIREVDDKLIALARSLRGRIITNDFNLNKVAELNGVSVLNINELANALRPVVLPGEQMKVHILREGKEVNQGVAYLDDGTMVVVDNAKKFIGRNIEVAVTSVLQTTAGRMIFAQLREDQGPEAPVSETVAESSGG